MPKQLLVKTRQSNIFFHLALLASVLAFLMTQSLWAAPKVNISGYLVLESDPYRFVEAETFKSYNLRASTEAAKQAISKLKNFDAISGVATVYDSETLILESVEFVGLRRLLGKWKGPSDLYQFVDYNNVQISNDQKVQQISYALSPGAGDTWRLFFTDKDSVTLGSLQIQNEAMIIETYHPDTGAILQTFPLTRVRE